MPHPVLVTADDHERLHRIADVLESPSLAGEPNEPQPANPLQFAPLIERAPELTAEAVRKVFDEAAERVMQTADAVMQVAIDLVAEAKETAATLREMGEGQATTIGAALTMARELNTRFKDEAKRVTAFRAAGGAP